MRIVNLTPHAVTLMLATGELTFPAAAQIARISETRSGGQSIELDGVEVPIVVVEEGTVEHLPEPKAGVVYLVSRLAAAKISGRSDVVFPLDEVRDEHGQILGCRRLGRFE